jgi:hypothetical protein
LVVIRQADLAAYATSFEAPAEPFGRAELLDHHAIIVGIAGQAASILPARFPTWLADGETLRRELLRRQAEFVEALERVRGRAEIAVTAVWTAASAAGELAPVEAATPGRTYLLGRQQAFAGDDARRARGRALADQIEALVGSDLVEVRHQVCPSGQVAVSSAVLVPRESAEHVRARLTRAEQDVRILVNGPWPPYTFASVV